MKKSIFTALAGYAAGLAIAMKLRKDKGTSKLAGDAKSTTFGNVVDEIVDIHKSAYHEVKSFIETTFDDVKDVDGLKTKVAQMTEEFTQKAEHYLEDIKDGAEDKKAEAVKFLEDLYAKANVALKKGEEKAKVFGEEGEEKAKTLIADAQTKVEESYKTLKTKFEKAAK